MKTITSCEDVFETLTAGPFPTGDERDSPIREHLAGCPECRKLADALRPACNLLRESLSDIEKRSLPVFRDEEEERVCSAVQRIMAEVQLPVSVASRGRDHRGQAYVFATCVLGALCVSLLVLLLAIRHDEKDSMHPTGLSYLDSMQLSKQCLTPTASSSVGAAKMSTVHTALINAKPTYLCCTECHNNTVDGIGTHANDLLAACGACHN